MRNGQNKRMRNRNRKGQNPMTRVYESNGPDVKIRGTASHIAEKYVQLARDAQGSGDPVGAENYYQHAEHYFRIIASAQEQFRQTQPYFRNEGEARDDLGDDGEGESYGGFGAEPGYAGREQPSYPPREQPQPYHQPREAREPREQPAYRQQPAREQPREPIRDDGDVDRLPSFITGGASAAGGGDEQPRTDRFAHRRRRRHHGPRTSENGTAAAGDDFGSGAQPVGE